MSRRKQRSAFDQVSEFDRGRIVAYQDCALSFRKIGSRVGRNQTTVMRICDRWMQEGTKDRRGRGPSRHPPQCTTSRADWQIVRMAVTDRSVTSRTVAQPIESVIQCLRVPFDAVYSRVVCPQDVHYLVNPWRRTTDVSAANGVMKEGCGWQNGRKLPLLTSHASVCNATMVEFKSGDTVERGC
ncbi:HTH_38 domain-containing protein [Trichonephila clavipes]|nr:HTH_38 domain-containing protein [Trichonephila clavipes]